MKSKGPRRGTRSLLKKKSRRRGKTGLSAILREFKSGDRVVVKIDPSVHKGMPHHRFHGRVGVVSAHRGQAYVVHITQGKATKEVMIRPEHLEPFRT